MNSLDAVEVVLNGSGEPLHYHEITRRILEKKLWATEGLTPDATINARLAVDIKRKDKLSRFQRTAPGIFALRLWGMEEYNLKKKEIKLPDDSVQQRYQPTTASLMRLNWC